MHDCLDGPQVSVCGFAMFIEPRLLILVKGCPISLLSFSTLKEQHELEFIEFFIKIIYRIYFVLDRSSNDLGVCIPMSKRSFHQ